MKYLMLGLAGLSFGMLVSAGVMTVFISVGLIPRFAQKTNTAKYIITYENAVIYGAVIGNIVTVFYRFLQLQGKYLILGEILLGLFGLLGGIFEGCVALAIAEMLDSIPILTRRTGLHQGLSIMVASIALGKLAGSLYYFYYQMYG